MHTWTANVLGHGDERRILVGARLGEERRDGLFRRHLHKDRALEGARLNRAAHANRKDGAERLKVRLQLIERRIERETLLLSATAKTHQKCV